MVYDYICENNFHVFFCAKVFLQQKSKLWNTVTSVCFCMFVHGMYSPMSCAGATCMSMHALTGSAHSWRWSTWTMSLPLRDRALDTSSSTCSSKGLFSCCWPCCQRSVNKEGCSLACKLLLCVFSTERELIFCCNALFSLDRENCSCRS